MFAIGICKAAGAARIIATDVNETRMALAKRMGAHDVVRPEKASAAVKAATEGLGVDVVLEMSGVPAAVHQAFELVRVGGHVQMLGIPAKTIDVDFATEVIFKGITIYGVVGRRMYDTWHKMTRFLRSGLFDPTPVITHRFPLEGADEAIRAIKSGEAGKVNRIEFRELALHAAGHFTKELPPIIPLKERDAVSLSISKEVIYPIS